jgi:hypothetical protein
MSPASAEGGDTERYVCPTHGEVTPSDEWLEQMGWVCPEQDCSEALERPAQGFWVEVDGTPVHVQGGPMNEKTQAVLFDIARAAFRKMDAEDVGDVQNMIEHAPTEPNAPAPRGAEQERCCEENGNCLRCRRCGTPECDALSVPTACEYGHDFPEHGAEGDEEPPSDDEWLKVAQALGYREAFSRCRAALDTANARAEGERAQGEARLALMAKRRDRAEAELAEARRINEFDIAVPLAEVKRERDELAGEVKRLRALLDKEHIPWRALPEGG